MCDVCICVCAQGRDGRRSGKEELGVLRVQTELERDKTRLYITFIYQIWYFGCITVDSGPEIAALYIVFLI